MWLKFWVEDGQEGTKLGPFLRSKEVSAALLKQVKYGQWGILVNGVSQHTNYIVKKGDEISLWLTEEFGELKPQPMALQIVKETEHFVLLDKPAGLVVHPTLNHWENTLGTGWMGVLASRGQQGVFRPVNRLDKDTSGLVLVAKNSYSAALLPKYVEKVYLAVAMGEMPLGDGQVDLPIARCDGSVIKREVSPLGQPSTTQYTVLAVGNGYSLLRLRLVTGRTHQIRVHMAALGHPLAGDWLYGENTVAPIQRQALHCFGMKIPSFLNQKEEWFFTPPPEDMQYLYHQIALVDRK